jgi:ribosomal protein S17E
MPRYFEIVEREVEELLDALRYVVSKEGEVIDNAMAGYLTEIVDRISSHVLNENVETFKTVNTTITEIDLIQQVLGRVKEDA